MYIDIIFILYLTAILISLVCLVFIGLIFVRKKDRSNETYRAARRFAVVVMLTGLLYFIFYYREIVQQQYDLSLPFRIADYTLCTALFLCWIFMLGNLLNREKHKRAIHAGVILSIIRLIASLFVTTAFMGRYYNIDDPGICRLWMMMETGFIFATSLLILYCTVCSIAECISRLRKIYVITGSALLLLWSTIQGIVDMGLFTGKYGTSAWALETPDLTGAILFLLNLATCIFVFQEDFSPLFFHDKAAESSPGCSTDMMESLNAIAASHKLTVREREVLELIYNGYTNPAIAETLYISINTVKKHVHNIFEKLDAGGRMEVVHLINAWETKK